MTRVSCSRFYEMYVNWCAVEAASDGYVSLGLDALAGLEMGGIPVATVLSQLSGLPTRFVRKQAKTCGTCQLAEGGEISGQRIAIIEDVTSEIRPDWDLSKPGLREAWDSGDYAPFHGWGKRSPQSTPSSYSS